MKKDRSANGTSASVGLAGRIMRSNRRNWLGRMRPDRGGAAELPIYAQGRICLVGAENWDVEELRWSESLQWALGGGAIRLTPPRERKS